MLKKLPENTDPMDALRELSGESRDELLHALRERWTLYDTPILIVEDQPFSQKLLSSMLARNYPCYAAQSIRRGMKLYIEHAPCILLLDVNLGDGTGHEMARAIRTIDAEAYIVMITANNYSEDVRIAQENDVNGFIIKPYNKRKILKTLAHFKLYKKERKRK